MATQTVATLTPAQIASVTVVSNEIGKAAALTVPANTFVFWAGFDGTRNDMNNLQIAGDSQSSAVGELDSQLILANDGNKNVDIQYYPGV